MKYKCYEHIPYTICSAVQRGYGREPSDMSPHKATSRIFEILFIFISQELAFLLVVLQLPCTLSHDVFQPFFSSKTITAIFTKVRPIVKFTFLRVLKSATICHTNILTNIILKSSEQINMSFSVCVFSFPLSATSPVSSPTSTTLKESLS